MLLKSPATHYPRRGIWHISDKLYFRLHLSVTTIVSQRGKAWDVQISRRLFTEPCLRSIQYMIYHTCTTPTEVGPLAHWQNSYDVEWKGMVVRNVCTDCGAIYQSSDDKPDDMEALLVRAGLIVTKADSFAPALRAILPASRNLATASSA